MTIIICTYNRAELLADCLESLTEQTGAEADWSVLVVDNNSPDDTATVAESFRGRLPGLRIVTETQQGLSFARNRGFREATTDWVVYLDDDAKAAPDFVARAHWMMEHTDYPFFGGVFLPWYRYGRPHWYRDAYGSNKLKHSAVTTLRGDEYASGGIMAIRRDLLERYNGFHTGIGMAGGKVGYAEETELQERIRRDGYQVGYDPDWIIYHVVAPYKLNVDWFFKSAFALGRDKVQSGMTASSGPAILAIALAGLGLTTVDLIRNSFKLALRKDYYIENWLIDTFRKAAKRVGMIYTGLLHLAAERRD